MNNDLVEQIMGEVMRKMGSEASSAPAQPAAPAAKVAQPNCLQLAA